MTQPNLLELAKRGHIKAIETLLNRSLKNVYISAKASIKDDCLYLILESDRDVRNINKSKIVEFVNKKVTEMQSEIINTVKVYGRQIGEDLPVWIQEFKLGDLTNPETLQAIEKEQ